MIKNMFKVISIPFVYVLFIILALLKWSIVAPLLFILYLIKNTLFWLIVCIIVGIFFSPIISIIIIVFFTIPSISNIVSKMSNGCFGDLKIPWDYANNVFLENKEDRLIRKRERLLKKANKKYKAASDEFEGFNRIADIYRK